jgi:hypothetical protein
MRDLLELLLLCDNAFTNMRISPSMYHTKFHFTLLYKAG